MIKPLLRKTGFFISNFYPEGIGDYADVSDYEELIELMLESNLSI